MPVVSCARCATDNPDSAKFCSECGAALAAPAAREQRKVVTVLFCDVAGSTALGQHVDPEALRVTMGRYYETARTAIERHGGTVEKFIGDAVMAVFGVPVAHEDDALRAVRAGVELRDAVEIDVRIGINTGEVVTAAGETLATGEAINIAARLEQAAGLGEVLLGAETSALVRELVDVELLPPLDVKGKSDPITAYRLRALTGAARRRDAAPMVGRAKELDALQRAFERARDDHVCHLFTILGTAGIGKSRLVSEFLGAVGGARVLTGRCLSYGDGITYWPVVEVLNQLGTPLESVMRDGTTPPEIAWAVRKVLEQAALDQPLIVVFDDIQWGEPTFLDLVEHVADLSRGAPILLLCMARPELLDERPGWGGGKLNATSVLLEPLPHDETDELVHLLLGGADEPLVERIREAADGNPLFVEEMVELARETGGDVAVPPTIHALLTARLDSLPLQEREVLERGAVEGQVFHRDAVVALAPDETQIDLRLVALVRKELVRPEQATPLADDAYRFRHLLIRDAAYEAVPKAVRIDLHERFARWLEEHCAELVELDEIAGYHLEQAALYARELGRESAVLGKRAAVHLAQSAIHADARGDVGAAVKLGVRAERLVERDDPRRLVLLPLLARALDDSGRSAEALPLLDEAVEHGDPVSSARARAIRAVTKSQSQGLGTDWALAEAELAIAQLTPLGDDAALADAYIALAWTSLWAGLVSRMGYAAERALEHAERAGDVAVQVEAIGLQASALLRGDGPLTRVESFVAEMLDREDLGYKLRANALFFRSRCDAEHLRTGAARALRLDAIRFMDDLGLAVLAAGTYQLGAMYEWLVAEWEEMERSARTAWDRLGAIGDRGVRSTAGALLAYACACQGREVEAEAILAEARALAEDDHVSLLWTACAESRLAAGRGEHARALEHALAADAVIEGREDVFNRLVVRIAVAEAHAGAGDLAAAAASIEEAAALAERRGSAAFLERARAVLAVAPQQ